MLRASRSRLVKKAHSEGRESAPSVVRWWSGCRPSSAGALLGGVLGGSERIRSRQLDAENENANAQTKQQMQQQQQEIEISANSSADETADGNRIIRFRRPQNQGRRRARGVFFFLRRFIPACTACMPSVPASRACRASAKINDRRGSARFAALQSGRQ